jgi:hypothetical protein
MFHFYSEIDKNNSKSLNGRAAVSNPGRPPVRADDRLELGVSGEWGGQDRATDNAAQMWLAGLDLQYLSVNFVVKGLLIEGRSPGHPDPVDNLWGLHLIPSGYLEVDLAAARHVRHLRARRVPRRPRHARHRPHLRHQGMAGHRRRPRRRQPAHRRQGRVPAQREYGGINEFDNDIVTSSMVLFF